MNNTLTHAEREFEILGKLIDPNNPDSTPIIWEFKDEILALVKKFEESGQSGGSAPFTASAISQAVKKLCMHEPVGPITGEDWEWDNTPCERSSGRIIYQNNRLSSVFKDGKDGTPYYIDAVVFRNQNGACFTGKVYKPFEVSSKQYIKAFPFYPKIFYIDVIDTEVAKDDWESELMDPKQLDEVRAYYDFEAADK